jgi:hypothetical protein
MVKRDLLKIQHAKTNFIPGLKAVLIAIRNARSLSAFADRNAGEEQLKGIVSSMVQS